MKKELFAEFLGISRATLYNYLSENPRRPVVDFVIKYLSEKDIEEFISTKIISKFEGMSDLAEFDNFFSEVDIGFLEKLGLFFSTIKRNKDISSFEKYSKSKCLLYFAKNSDADFVNFDKVLGILEKFEPTIRKLGDHSKDDFLRLNLFSKLRELDNFKHFLSVFLEIDSSKINDNFSKK